MTKRTLGIILAALVLAAVGVSVSFWEHLSKVDAPVTVRDVYLIAAGLGAAAIGWWRGSIAEKQQDTAKEQERISSTRLTVERFQKGVELLGGTKPAVKIGGIQALTNLAIAEKEALPGPEPPPVYDMVVDILRLFITVEETRQQAPFYTESDDQSEHPVKVAEQCLRILRKGLEDVDGKG